MPPHTYLTEKWNFQSLIYVTGNTQNKIGRPSTDQQNVIRMACRWLANGGPRLYAGWVSTVKYINEMGKGCEFHISFQTRPEKGI